MLDRMAVLMPAWSERNPADLGVALVEALAYSADQLSYQQDAVATEAYLGTARQRISVRRHARLMDYFISEGCNARAWVHSRVSRCRSAPFRRPAIPAGTKFSRRIPGQRHCHRRRSARLRAGGNQFSKTMEPVDNLCSSITTSCSSTPGAISAAACRKGATSATLDGAPSPISTPGTILIFEEVLGAETGSRCRRRSGAAPRASDLTTVQFTAPDNSPLTDPVTGARSPRSVGTTKMRCRFPFVSRRRPRHGYQRAGQRRARQHRAGRSRSDASRRIARQRAGAVICSYRRRAMAIAARRPNLSRCSRAFVRA